MKLLFLLAAFCTQSVFASGSFLPPPPPPKKEKIEDKACKDGKDSQGKPCKKSTEKETEPK